MRMSVSKKEFVDKIWRRPALIKSLVNPSESTIVDCVGRNADCMKYLSYKQKTKAVCEAYLGSSYADMAEIPLSVWPELDGTKILEDILAKWTEKERDKIPYSYIKLCEKLCPHFADLPLDLCKRLVTLGVSIVNERSWSKPSETPTKVFPEKHMSHLIDLYITWSLKESGREDIPLPNEYWTATRALRIIRKKPANINNCPVELRTRALWVEALKQGIGLSQTPDVWDDALVDIAIDANEQNITSVPAEFINKARALKAVKKNGYLIDTLPKAIASDIDIQLTAIQTVSWSEHTRKSEMDTFPILKEEKYRLQVLKESEQGLKDVIAYCQHHTKDFDWLTFIKTNPLTLKHIEKKNQTAEMIDTLINSHSPEKIDEVAEYINFTKIKRNHAPMLVGCKNSSLVGFITTRLNPAEKTSAASTGTSDMVEIDLSPAEATILFK